MMNSGSKLCFGTAGMTGTASAGAVGRAVAAADGGELNRTLRKSKECLKKKCSERKNAKRKKKK